MGEIKNRRWLLVGVFLLTVLLISYYIIIFKDKPVSSGNGQLDDIKPIIGISVDALAIERWQKDINILKAKAEELGYQVEVTNAYEDIEMQQEQIRSLVKAGAKTIFIIPYDKDELSEVVNEAKKKGVIIIAYDRMINNADIDAYVSFDNVGVGEYMAKALVEVVPKGNYVIINGSPKDNNSKLFNEGYYRILEPYISSGDIAIIKEEWADNWRKDVAYNIINELLADGEEIDAIIGANDMLAEGAISALAEYGLAGEIAVVGHDAEISACQRIVDGKQLMTVYKPLKTLAEGAIETAVLLMNNEEIDYRDTIFDGSKEVPYIKFDVIPVTKANMRETVIEDLFHNEEDVYRDSN